MTTYLQDVLSQPENLRDCLAGLAQQGAKKAIKSLSAGSYDKIVMAGMGSSNYCLQGAGILLTECGMNSVILSASELLHYELSAITESTLLVLVSQSGESVEIVRILEKLPKRCTVAAITNNPDSSLAKRADYVFLMGVAEEEAVTTRTYISSIAIANLIAAGLGGLSVEKFLQQLLKTKENMDALLAGHEAITNTLVQELGFPPYLCVLGRGESLSSVNAGTLFLREIAKYPAFGSDSGEFRHGPMEMVDENFKSIVLAPYGKTTSLQHKLADDIVEKSGGVVLIGIQSSAQRNTIPTIILPSVPEWLSPFLTILPIQLYANRLAEARGFIPGKFRWGNKITTNE